MSERDIAVLEAKLNFMQEKFSRIEELIIKHVAHEEQQWDTLMDRLDKKYASKYTETFVIGLI